MKKVLLFIILFSIGILNIQASINVYYTNNNGVSFTKEEYDYFSQMYFVGYQDYMTKEDYHYFDKEIMNSNLVETSWAYNNTPLRATSINYNGRTLKISKTSANNYSVIAVTATWNYEPTVKSYDVIGARLDNVSLASTPSTKLINSSGSSNYNLNVNSNNGFGASVLLSGSAIKVTQTFKVSNGGTVYASYQHANSNISLNDSKRYGISSNGFGDVFGFTGTAFTTYDRAPGVNIAV